MILRKFHNEWIGLWTHTRRECTPIIATLAINFLLLLVRHCRIVVSYVYSNRNSIIFSLGNRLLV